MNIKNGFWIAIILLTLNSCALLKSGPDKIVPEWKAQLKISSLHARQIQEKGVIGTQDGDELALIYSLNAYNENGSLVSVSNGLWGTRTHQQNALILSDEFDRISVSVPQNGKVLLALMLIEVDDYKGERKMGNIRPHTRTERYPRMLESSSFEKDQNLSPLDLIANSLKIAGYKNFKSRHMNLSINDELGSTRKVYEAADLTRMAGAAQAGKETFEMDGSQINEKFLYVLKYDLDVTKAAR